MAEDLEQEAARLGHCTYATANVRETSFPMLLPELLEMNLTENKAAIVMESNGPMRGS
jgi:hypothetical protein